MFRLFANPRKIFVNILMKNERMFAASKKPLANMNENQVYETLKRRYRKTAAINTIVDNLLYPDLGPQTQETLINMRLSENPTEEGKKEKEPLRFKVKKKKVFFIIFLLE